MEKTVVSKLVREKAVAARMTGSRREKAAPHPRDALPGLRRPAGLRRRRPEMREGLRAVMAARHRIETEQEKKRMEEAA